MTPRRLSVAVIAIALSAIAALGLTTKHALMPIPATLPPAPASMTPVFTARDGTPLNRTFTPRYNYTQRLPLWRVPDLIKKAFVASEDKRYWQHAGADWRARISAMWTNIIHGEIIRGASTIGEQAARILEPRPHTYWGHWTAGFDANRLLDRFGHARVLEFYLNQVPYGGQRRGIVQAAHYYFGNAPGTLSAAEQLALAVIVRSPVTYNPATHPGTLRQAVDRLARRMHAQKRIDDSVYATIETGAIQCGQWPLAIHAAQFVRYAQKRAQARDIHEPRIPTTLDPALEHFVQQALRARLETLVPRGADNAAALVVDNATGDILAWATAPAGNPFGIDPMLNPRQPGSALKPFVYGLAIETLGWQGSTVINDAPLAEKVRRGVHSYRNYSGHFYGPISLRYALANSLNIPAVKTAQAVGVKPILGLFHELGFTTFHHNAQYYGPAIALGDGPVRLFDMVQAYSTLARHGQFLPLRVFKQTPVPPARPVLQPAVTSLLADILSDPAARAAEFGPNSVLDLPWPTAVKTGTSSDYRDAWTMGFDDRYTVGVWMGRLDGGHMQRVTGSSGPALVLRRIFNYLRRGDTYAGLWRSPRLVAVQACEKIGTGPCIARPEWRVPGDTEPVDSSPTVVISRPVSGEVLAIDPRLKRSTQRYEFAITATDTHIDEVIWSLDGETIATTRDGDAVWQLSAGQHSLSARVRLEGDPGPRQLGPVEFTVIGMPGPPLANKRAN